MSIDTLKRMSRTEKIQLMELLWEDLSRSENAFVSPDWHAQELKETQSRLDHRQEQIVDWEVAKKELRRRFE